LKKFFNRVRCWLIKKLGGYTEPLPTTPVEVAVYHKDIASLCWECAVPMGVYSAERDMQTHMLHMIDRRAKEELADKLFDNGFVEVRTLPFEPGNFNMRRRYVIHVARP